MSGKAPMLTWPEAFLVSAILVALAIAHRWVG